jgi:hypothetical protein
MNELDPRALDDAGSMCTAMSFDPAFYYNRPVNIAAAHGYGPVIMAGAEVIKLIKNYQVVINDAAVMFYPLGTDWRNFR